MLPGDWLLDPVERLPGLLGHLHARALGQLGHEGEAARGAEVEPGPLVILVQGGVLVLLRHVPNLGWVFASAANRLIGEDVQSRRRPLLGPSPG